MSASLLERVGLHRPELRAWAFYDWANSVFMTTVLQVFPIYFRQVAAVDLSPAVASTRFAIATSVSIATVALISPVLGAMADAAGNKKKLLAASLALGSAATAAMFLVHRGEWVLGALLFMLGNVGVTASIVFYNSLLPHIAAPEEIDRVSTAGFALGYVGGGLLLSLNLVWISRPALLGLPDEETGYRLSFLSAALWWAAFSLPLFLRVAEPPRRQVPGEDAAASLLRKAFGRLAQTVRQARRHRDAVLMLVAFLIYNDGITTIVRMSTTYGSEIGIPGTALIVAILMVQFVGVPFAFLFGQLAGWIGAKRAVLLALAVYGAIAVLGYRMKTTADFFVLALLVATVQGGAQALGRALYASMIPRSKSAEMFGFFGVFDKFGGVMGSTLFALMAALTGSSRPAILAVLVFFALGAALLSRVDVEAGRRAAREDDAGPEPRAAAGGC